MNARCGGTILVVKFPLVMIVLPHALVAGAPALEVACVSRAILLALERVGPAASRGVKCLQRARLLIGFSLSVVLRVLPSIRVRHVCPIQGVHGVQRCVG
jgi:hypothetical protein